MKHKNIILFIVQNCSLTILNSPETLFLKNFRRYSTKGHVSREEFPSGEDDMAFIVSPSPDQKKTLVANDVISIPASTTPKQRLSVSFAIAQSAILSIFEARIEKKITDYKYIPETLAAHGKVHLNERQLGIMIGEIFVIRHDVNLHTEILDTPGALLYIIMHGWPRTTV